VYRRFVQIEGLADIRQGHAIPVYRENLKNIKSPVEGLYAHALFPASHNIKDNKLKNKPGFTL
jgi:hypothetical protein